MTNPKFKTDTLQSLPQGDSFTICGIITDFKIAISRKNPFGARSDLWGPYLSVSGEKRICPLQVEAKSGRIPAGRILTMA